MAKFSKKDLYFSLITGLTTGFIAWQIFVFLELPEFAGVSYSWLIILIPILWFLGINLGYFLGQWLAFFNQFGKFAAVGLTNAAVYFAILNILISQSGINKGIWYSVFVVLAFTIATVHSYFWNKFWVFETAGNGAGKQEFGKFFGVSIVAGLINVGIASGVVNFVVPLWGLTPNQWANIGGIVGSAVALMASFTGFKLAVFNK